MDDLFGSFVIGLQLGLPIALLVLGYVAGRIAESRHYKSIHAREKVHQATPAVSWRTLHDDRSVMYAMLSTGSVVVSVDHYKRFLMFFRKIFGGEVRSYASLIDRGRREAILRMKEACPTADLFLNCRIETSTISNGQGKATGTVEILAYGTAIKFAE
ncbi:MAG: YbjQ family protein [bacterium]|nr:YbjQ family protein [bacterium]